MTFATRQLAAARRLIRKYGQSASFARVTEGSFVPSTGAVGAGSTTNYSAYVVPLSTSGKSTTSEIENVESLQKDLDILIEVNSSSSVPAIGDVVTISGVAHRILVITKYVAQGATILYKAQVKV